MRKSPAVIDVVESGIANDWFGAAVEPLAHALNPSITKNKLK